jgi:hypothetical protein
MTLRGVLTWIVGIVVLAFGLAVTENVKELYKQRGVNTLLIRLLDKLPTELQDTLRWSYLRMLWWVWLIFGLSGGIALALWLAPFIIFAPERDGSAQAKQQDIAAQEHIHSIQSDLEAQTKELNAEKQARMSAEQRASSSQDKLATVQQAQKQAEAALSYSQKTGLPDPTPALNILWMAKSLVEELQHSDTGILITAAPPNDDLGSYFTHLFEMGGVLDQWVTNHGGQHSITVKLPDYNTELDTPKFDASNYPGISVHGDTKYIGKEEAGVRPMIIDLFERMHLCTTDIGWTQKAIPQLSQYYGRNIIWIEIGARAARC